MMCFKCKSKTFIIRDAHDLYCSKCGEYIGDVLERGDKSLEKEDSEK